MTETERELGLQLGDAHAEIRELKAQRDDASASFKLAFDYSAARNTEVEALKEERDNALRASRWESDLCQQALADLGPYRADAERYRAYRKAVMGEDDVFLETMTRHLEPSRQHENDLDDAIDAAMKETTCIEAEKPTVIRRKMGDGREIWVQTRPSKETP